MEAKTIARAKAEVWAPSWRPIAVARAATVAQIEEGIPPDTRNLLESHLFSFNLYI